MTIRSRKAYKSILKRHTRLGHITSFSILELFSKISAAVIDGTCPYCFGALNWENFSPDHVVPLQKGGSPELSNIEVVCFLCNREKNETLNWSYDPEVREKRLMTTLLKPQ